VQTYFSESPPDVILYDPFSIAGRILGVRQECPVIRVSPHFAQYERSLVRQDGIFKTPSASLEYRDKLDAFLMSHGITTRDNMWYTEKLNIQLIPREFQFCGDSFDRQFCFVGALLDRKFEPRWKDNSANRPIVLVSDFSGTLGAWESSIGYYKQLIESLADSSGYYVLSIGEAVDARSLGSLPENFEINRRASHLEILPHAALSVCHGGVLSTLEALYNGVPVLAIPQTPGTEEVANRTAELGLGTQIPRRKLVVDELAKTIKSMLGDTELRVRVKRMQRVFRRSAGVGLAADRIEGFGFQQSGDFQEVRTPTGLDLSAPGSH
jgi:MGT family glycosyltransferase